MCGFALTHEGRGRLVHVEQGDGGSYAGEALGAGEIWS